MERRKNRFRHFENSILFLGIALFFSFLLVSTCFAETIILPGPPTDLPGTWTNFPDLVWWLVGRAKMLLAAVAVFYIVYYGARMALASGNDETVKKSKLALTYAAIGFVIINADYVFKMAFNPADNIGSGPDIENQWRGIIMVIIYGLRWLAGGIAVAWLVLSGFRMITAAGKEEVLTKNKTQVIWSIFGLIIVALAGVFQNIVFGNCPEEQVLIAGYCSPNTTQGVKFFASIINLMLTFIVPLGLLFLIIGGMYMILAHGNDAMLTKGKKIIQWTVIALVIIYSSYVIVNELARFAGLY